MRPGLSVSCRCCGESCFHRLPAAVVTDHSWCGGGSVPARPCRNLRTGLCELSAPGTGEAEGPSPMFRDEETGRKGRGGGTRRGRETDRQTHQLKAPQHTISQSMFSTLEGLDLRGSGEWTSPAASFHQLAHSNRTEKATQNKWESTKKNASSSSAQQIFSECLLAMPTGGKKGHFVTSA